MLNFALGFVTCLGFVGLVGAFMVLSGRVGFGMTYD